ncbi:MAG: fluoride efflux transporter CrcB [Actinomycetota bacterium]|nr:fluoride efflux transporter CrcB [Actinomycetota bacterium]
MNVLLVAIGGAIGAAARYLAGLWIAARFGADFPWGTFFVNVTGSFLIGIVLVLVQGGTLPAGARLFVAIGILGGYTTFSSFSYETLQLLNNGDVMPVLLNTLGQLLLGLLAVYLGVAFARGVAGA